ncbi:FAD dependent oxidoreductase-domain-containing protein [Dactylonectria estremocensis]|uniref:FAD dependent oxidoreductase-domain-containing protein n=1 Tax=Dactylonectria estremocensis TaxID=1079267 RepID=A0A9P9EFN6_9HYPO|nr:FAD dependent oxidoreductase-domain-containing protein [Dactylonectria estremocensis]
MTNPDFLRDVKKRIQLPPGLPSANPTTAAWQEPAHPVVSNAQSPRLSNEADIVIIGSGVSGCSVAHSLLHNPAAANLRVTMLEARTAVSGATGRNGGHLVSDSDSLFSSLVASIGLEQAVETVRFSEANIKRLAELIAQLSPADQDAVEFRSVKTVTSFGDRASFKDAVQIIEQLTKAVPDGGVTYKVTPKEDMDDFKFKDTAGITEQHGVAALWPYRLMTIILMALKQEYHNRFSLETNTPVLSIDYESTTQSSHPYTLHTPRGNIRAKQIIHCTNGYSARLIPNLAGKLYPLRGTMSTQKMGPSFPHLGDRVSWSHITKGSYDEKTGLLKIGLYYAQQNAKTGIMFLGGEAQKLDGLLTSDDSFVASDARASLTSVAPHIWKDATPVTPLAVWSGIMGFTADGMPLVGRLPEQLTGRAGRDEWISAGFNGHGMDKCWLSGEAVARMVLGEGDVPGFPRAYLVNEKRLASFSLDMAAETLMEHIVDGGSQEPKSNL